ASARGAEGAGCNDGRGEVGVSLLQQSERRGAFDGGWSGVCGRFGWKFYRARCEERQGSLARAAWGGDLFDGNQLRDRWQTIRGDSRGSGVVCLSPGKELIVCGFVEEKIRMRAALCASGGGGSTQRGRGRWRRGRRVGRCGRCRGGLRNPSGGERLRRRAGLCVRRG